MSDWRTVRAALHVLAHSDDRQERATAADALEALERLEVRSSTAERIAGLDGLSQAQAQEILRLCEAEGRR